jgi:hypothetical protein
MAGETLAEFVVQLGEIRFHHIAVRFLQNDRPIGGEGAALHVIDHLGGRQHIGAVGQLDGARGRRHFRLSVVEELVGHHIDAGALGDRLVGGGDEFRRVRHARLGRDREKRHTRSSHQAQNADLHPDPAPLPQASNVPCHLAPDAKFQQVLTAFRGAVKT